MGDYGFFLAFEQLRADVATLTVMVAAIVTELSEDEEVKALAAELRVHSKGLKESFPAATGTPAPQ